MAISSEALSDVRCAMGESVKVAIRKCHQRVMKVGFEGGKVNDRLEKKNKILNIRTN